MLEIWIDETIFFEAILPPEPELEAIEEVECLPKLLKSNFVPEIESNIRHATKVIRGETSRPTTDAEALHQDVQNIMHHQQVASAHPSIIAAN